MIYYPIHILPEWAQWLLLAQLVFLILLGLFSRK